VSESYPPIGDYALIGDCESAALISLAGSIDWAVCPRIDEGSCFGRLLDWRRGGHFSIGTDGEPAAHRAYLDHTLVLATTFVTGDGECVVYDCFAADGEAVPTPRRQLLRIAEGRRGVVTLDVVIEPRFDYGEIGAWVRQRGSRLWSAVGGNDALLLWSDRDLDLVDGRMLQGSVEVRAGDRFRVSMSAVRPADLDRNAPAAPRADEVDRRLDETIDWWRRWVAPAAQHGADEGVVRSAIVLKALTSADTGAIAAAPTTSVPEAVGEERNWDYRYSWIRDAQFTVRSLVGLGFDAEANAFRQFIERTAAGTAEGLQNAYGVGGERRLTEVELPHLEGYRQSAPVRIGNRAVGQLQLDVFGYVLELAWQWHERGAAPDDDYWRFLASLVDAACERWAEPDSGIWELREHQRHLVHSKAMCWVAIDRGLRLAEAGLRRAPVRRWRATCDEIRHAVETKGWSESRQSFVRAFETDDLDASLLLLPSYGFVPYDDPRMVSTTDAVWNDLDDGNGLLLRYRSDDGLPGREGAFVACTFWLAECLARQGRLAEAQRVFDRACGASNDIGLFAEEYDSAAAELRGNFPQGISHLSHVAAALALAEETSRLGTFQLAQG
jgi:GH15 family glucan-1,4-alpha-glucosidase